MIRNYHIITVKYLHVTNKLPARIKLFSCRFKCSKILSHTDLSGLETSCKWLDGLGFNIIGSGEVEQNGDVIISDTFKPF